MSSKQSQLSGAEGKTMVAGTEGMISCPPPHSIARVTEFGVVWGGRLLTACFAPQHGHDSADPAEAGSPGPCPVNTCG